MDLAVPIIGDAQTTGREGHRAHRAVGPARSDRVRSVTQVLLFTGKGGWGRRPCRPPRRSPARTAACGRWSSTDPAHSPGGRAGCAGDRGRGGPLADRLWLEHIDARQLLERSWGTVQDYLLGVLSSAGVDSVAAEELTVLPGAEEVLALLEVRDKVRSGDYDVVVLDCARHRRRRCASWPFPRRWTGTCGGSGRSSVGWSRRCGHRCRRPRASRYPTPG